MARSPIKPRESRPRPPPARASPRRRWCAFPAPVRARSSPGMGTTMPLCTLRSRAPPLSSFHLQASSPRTRYSALSSPAALTTSFKRAPGRDSFPTRVPPGVPAANRLSPARALQAPLLPPPSTLAPVHISQRARLARPIANPQSLYSAPPPFPPKLVRLKASGTATKSRRSPEVARDLRGRRKGEARAYRACARRRARRATPSIYGAVGASDSRCGSGVTTCRGAAPCRLTNETGSESHDMHARLGVRDQSTEQARTVRVLGDELRTLQDGPDHDLVPRRPDASARGAQYCRS
ncbi:hypothetical protein B0H15DRAFT_990818 [Mycena belliarum]|uniref:Uncharacterized protein n=1 Tax=Mycena belliarum TaxID=1033014 RepID=A0AAD6UI29_9AGAR|nr:hypothetical protein B0H15DRAFT_990818 [Mycena belliae]